MGRLLDLLVLVLIDSAVRRLIELEKFISLDTDVDGGAISMTDWSWVDSLPSTDYCLSIWLKIDTPTSNTPEAVSFIHKSSFIRFYLNQGTTFKIYSPLVTKTGGEYTYGLWFHLAIGAFQTTVYYALTLKPGKPDLLSYELITSLDSTSQLLAPETGEVRFVVSVM